MKNLIMMKKIAFFSLSMLCICTLNASYTIAGQTSMNIDINKEFKNARELYNQRENREYLKAAIEIYQNVLKQIPDNSENYNKKGQKYSSSYPDVISKWPSTMQRTTMKRLRGLKWEKHVEEKQHHWIPKT